MSTDTGMEALVKAEYDDVEAAMMSLRNAFGYFDDGTDPNWSADTWFGAVSAAANLSDAADNLADVARKIARERQAKADALEEAA